MANKYVDNTKNSGVPVGAQYQEDNCTLSGSPYKTITVASGEPFNTCVVGDPFWVLNTGDGGYAIIGVYIISSIPNGNTVVLNRGAGNGSGDTGVSVAHTPHDGSAANQPWPTLQYALEQASAGDNIYVKANSGYKLDNLDQPNDDSSGNPKGLVVGTSGNSSNNTHVTFKGYKTTIGDMDYGGAYYGGALDAYKSAKGFTSYMTNPDAEWGDIDGDDIAAHLLTFGTNKSNIHFHNFKFHNVDTTLDKALLAFSNSSKNNSFTNCWFDDAYQVTNDDDMPYGSIMDSFFDNNFDDSPFTLDVRNSYSFTLIGCVFDVVTSEYPQTSGNAVAVGYGFLGMGNIFLNGSIGIQVGAYTAHIINNVFYNQIGTCIMIGGSTAVLVEYNNIFMPADHVNDYVVQCGAGYGSIIYSDYSCAFSTDGNAMDSGHAWPSGFKGAHSIEVAPQFVDTEHGDFRLRNPVLLLGGKGDVGGNHAQMGAIRHKYQFAKRARTANFGRLQIIR